MSGDIVSVNTAYRCITPERLEFLIEEARSNPIAPARFVRPEIGQARTEPKLWIERNWLGLHSLLTFGEWAERPLLGDAIAGGMPTGADYIYEDAPVRYFRREQVHAIAAEL